MFKNTVKYKTNLKMEKIQSKRDREMLQKKIQTGRDVFL